jgi:hypothetical protein
VVTSEPTPARNSTGYFVIYGNYLNATPTVTVDGYGVATSFGVPFSYTAPNQLNVQYNVAADADLGNHTVTIQTIFGSTTQPVVVQ